VAGIFSWLGGRPDPSVEIAAALCDGVIAKAREPALYLEGLVEDSFEGRFALSALYGGLLMRRLRQVDAGGLGIAERLGDALFDRYDYALREEGVGDASIARKARKLGEEFFGLARALDGVLGGEATSLQGVADVLARNGLGGGAPDVLARHVISSETRLQTCSDADLLRGSVDWG